MSKKFNYSTVTVDRVNKYVSHMIKNPNAYRVMDLLSNRDAIKKSPILNEEDMIYIEMVLDELDTTTTPKENMAICKIVNHALYNMDLPDDDGECIEEALQVIGDTIAENKMGDTTDIAYNAFSDILQGFGRLDVLGDADKDVLQVCAFVGLVNAAVETSMDNMYADIAASSTKDANKESKQEDTVEEEKKTETKKEESSDTKQEDSDEYQDAYDKIKDLTKKYFEGIADIAGYTGKDREEFLKTICGEAEKNFASSFNKAMNGKESANTNTDSDKTTRKTSESETKHFGDKESKKKKFVKKDVVGSGTSTTKRDAESHKREYDCSEYDQIVTNIADEMLPFVKSKIQNLTGCMKDIDIAYLYVEIAKAVQEIVDAIPADKLVVNNMFYKKFMLKHMDDVSQKAINATLKHTFSEISEGMETGDIRKAGEKLQSIGRALNDNNRMGNNVRYSKTRNKAFINDIPLRQASTIAQMF